jgi:lysophospholipase L1-like esterase
MFARPLALSILMAGSLCRLTAQEAQPLNWVTLPNEQIDVAGLPWYGENGGELFRLPVKLAASYRPPVWELGQSPSGGRIRFRTNSTTVAIRLEYPSGPGMANMQAFGQTGVDLYADGVYRATATAGKASKPGKTDEFTYFKDQPRTDREITLYLPLYLGVKVLGIGLDAEARVQRPKALALGKPVVFYGTSITQGGCASRPGMSYEAILGRMLNIDFVNLGFSGNGRGEPEVARTVASIDAAAYVIDFAQNNPTLDSLKQAYAPFLETLRSKRPDTPILVITPIYSAHESWTRGSRLEEMRALIRQAAAARIASGDRHLEIVEGTDLLGPTRGDGLVDGTHPNDLGFQWMAEGLAGRVGKVLGLQQDRD